MNKIYPDPDIINAGKQTISELPNSSYFSSADSFAVFQRPCHASPFSLIELAPGVTPEDVSARTTAHYAS